MLTLFYKPTCPHCQKVLAQAEELGVTFDLKDISSDEAVALELVKLGGKRQVPFLVDTERGTSLYESADIITYLNKNSSDAKEKHNGVRIHKSDAACDVCE